MDSSRLTALRNQQCLYSPCGSGGNGNLDMLSFLSSGTVLTANGSGGIFGSLPFRYDPLAGPNGGTVWIDGTLVVGNLSTSNLFVPGLFTSTVTGLGTAGYISSATLISTTSGLFSNIYNLINPDELASTVIDIVQYANFSSVGVPSTVEGLGTAGYLSSIPEFIQVSSISTYTISVYGGATLYVDGVSYLQSTSFINYGRASTLRVYSTIELVDFATNDKHPLYMSNDTLYFNSDTIYTLNNSISTTKGLGTAGYLSSVSFNGLVTSSNLASTVVGLGTAGYISALSGSPDIPSTVAGLGTAGYLSTVSFNGLISSSSLASTVEGLGTAGYLSTVSFNGLISSTSLASTVEGLGTAGYLSSLSFSNLVSSANLTSTVAGLGTAGYLSTVSFNGLVSSLNLTSTVEGLGTAGYLSTQSSIFLNATPTYLITSLSQFAGQGESNLTFDGQTLSTVNVELSGQLNIGSNIFYPQYGGLSINYNNDISDSLGQTAYNFGSGASNKDIVLGLSVNDEYTNVIGTTGDANTNEYVIGSLGSNTDFTIKNNLQSYPVRLDSGTSLFKVTSNGQIEVPYINQNDSIPFSLGYDPGTGNINYYSRTMDFTSTLDGLISTGSVAPRLGNVLTVDSVNGNDSLAVPGGFPYKTVNAAVSNLVNNDTIWILPGSYSLVAPIDLSPFNNVSIRGMSLQTVNISLCNVKSDTTLLTMGPNSRVEDVNMRLQTDTVAKLVGIEFPGTTMQTAKIRTSVFTVDDSLASTVNSNDVYCVECSGSNTFNTASFSFNCLKGSTFNVLGNGGGRKRGIIMSGPSVVTTRDINIYVKPPTDSNSTGSYVGVESSNASAFIQCRATAIGAYQGPGSYTASDILQTLGHIDIGPGTELVNKTAGKSTFTTFVYPTTIFYGAIGDINVNSMGFNPGWLWPGSLPIGTATPKYPDSAISYFRVQQPAILTSMFANLGGPTTGSGGSVSTTVTLFVNDIPQPYYTITFMSNDILKHASTNSYDLKFNDKISIQLAAGDGSTNLSHDLTVQLDLF